MTELLKLESPSADTVNMVTDIFDEFCAIKKKEDTIDRIKKHFSNEKIKIFVDCLARRVAEISEREIERGAGQLFKMLIQHTLISRDLFLRVLKDGLIADISDIKVDCPKVTSYISVFVFQVFGDDPNFNWLLELTRPLKEGQNSEEMAKDLIRDTLNQAQIETCEEHVKSLLAVTEGRDSISNDCLPWPVEESIAYLVTQIKPLLRTHENDDIFRIYYKNGWTKKFVEAFPATLIATCEVSLVDGGWDRPLLEKGLALLAKRAPSVPPNLWKYAKNFVETKNVTQENQEVLWSRLLELKLVSSGDRH